MYALLGFSVLFASLNSIFLHKAAIKKTTEVYFFNLVGAIVWIFILLCLNGKSLPSIDITSLLWGLLYGMVQFLFVFFKNRAMSCGDVSVTTLIGNCSLLVSLFVSSIVWHEQITIMQLFGTTLLIISIILSVYKKNAQDYSKSWMMYTIFFFIFASGVGIVFKAFSKYTEGSDASAMMICSALVMAVAYFFASIFSKKRKEEANRKIYKKNFLLFALISGVLSCGYNRINVFLSGALPAIIFFPGFNGGVVLLSALLSIIICSEKVSIKKVVALILGAISILIIGIF